MFPFKQRVCITTRPGSQLIVATFLLLLALAPAMTAQVIPTAGQLQANGAIAIVFTANTVSCSGLSPGDKVALVGFMIDRQSSSQTLSTPMFSQPANASGAFSATIPGGVKARSIWLLINQTSGSYTVAEPEGSVLTQIPDGAIALTGGAVASSAAVTISRAHTHAISISYGRQPLMDSKPGSVSAADDVPSGFSVIDAKDGSVSDEDGAINGSVHFTLPSFFDPSQSSTCLFVVDDRTLEFNVTYLEFGHSPRCPQGGCS
jgi:hypothetical protein